MESTPFPQGESMFDSLGKFNMIAPDPEEMKRQMEMAGKETKVNFLGIKANIYDMSSETDRVRYEADMNVIYLGIAKSTHILFKQDRQFSQSKSTWLIYLEWGEFELIEKDIVPVGVPKA